MATSKQDIERKIVELQAEIQAGRDVARNQQRLRYLQERLRQLEEAE